VPSLWRHILVPNANCKLLEIRDANEKLYEVHVGMVRGSMMIFSYDRRTTASFEKWVNFFCCPLSSSSFTFPFHLR